MTCGKASFPRKHRKKLFQFPLKLFHVYLIHFFKKKFPLQSQRPAPPSTTTEQLTAQPSSPSPLSHLAATTVIAKVEEAV